MCQSNRNASELPERQLPAEADSPSIPDITLCLSGGGFRAAIFHLGALRWLNECDVLSRLKKVSCVSGGSIIGAHLAHRFREDWPNRPLPEHQWLTKIETPFWEFVNRDIRTWPFLVRFLCPCNWFRPQATVEALQRQYVKYLFEERDVPLLELGKIPKFVFCATDMVFGVNWEATRERVGDYEAGYAKPPPTKWTLARAVAASSCFPPIFPPARTYLGPNDLKSGKYGKDDRCEKADRDKKILAIRLTDGGVYDNLGLQPAFKQKKVLVSDGGGAFQFALVDLPWRRLARYPALLQHGIGKLRKSWLMGDLKADPPKKSGTYWRIGKGSILGPPFYGDEEAEMIESIRTDLNRFTRAEFEILVNQGYLCAAEYTCKYAASMLLNPIPPGKVSPPYSKWESPQELRSALRRSRYRLLPYCLR